MFITAVQNYHICPAVLAALRRKTPMDAPSSTASPDLWYNRTTAAHRRLTRNHCSAGPSTTLNCCCCCSHINSHNQVRGHRTGSSHSGEEEHPTKKTPTKTKVVHTYIIADETELQLAGKTRHALPNSRGSACRTGLDMYALTNAILAFCKGTRPRHCYKGVKVRPGRSVITSR